RQGLDRRVGVNGKPELFGQRTYGSCRFPQIQRHGGTRLRTQNDVLGNGHRSYEHEVLVNHSNAKGDGIAGCTNDARLAVDDNLTAVGRIEPVGDPHGRRLACAVLADNRVNGAGIDSDVEVIVCEDGAEALGDVAQLEFHCAIASVTLISPAIIFFFASSAAAMASLDTTVRLLSSMT